MHKNYKLPSTLLQPHQTNTAKRFYRAYIVNEFYYDYEAICLQENKNSVFSSQRCMEVSGERSSHHIEDAKTAKTWREMKTKDQTSEAGFLLFCQAYLGEIYSFSELHTYIWVKKQNIQMLSIRRLESWYF